MWDFLFPSPLRALKILKHVHCVLPKIKENRYEKVSNCFLFKEICTLYIIISQLISYKNYTIRMPCSVHELL